MQGLGGWGWGGWGQASGGGLILSRFFSACLTEAPRQRNRSSHYPYLGKTSWPFLVTLKIWTGQKGLEIGQRWAEAGEPSTEASGSPLLRKLCIISPGNYDTLVPWESRLFGKKKKKKAELV